MDTSLRPSTWCLTLLVARICSVLVIAGCATTDSISTIDHASGSTNIGSAHNTDALTTNITTPYSSAHIEPLALATPALDATEPDTETEPSDDGNDTLDNRVDDPSLVIPDLSGIGEEILESTAPDLWPRMRQAFTIPGGHHPRVLPHVRWYAKHPDFLDRTFDRARPFLHYVVTRLEKRGVPVDLALLPVVESAYQAFAHSRAHASGIWQFIPNTGRRYGLKISWWYDGRLDFIPATDAAISYLQDLHKMFGGDWLLALAAYNSGEGTVARAIERNRRRNKPTDFWSLKLPRETRSYVPQLLAIRHIVADPAAYGYTLHEIPDEPYLTTYDAGTQIDLALAADLAGLTLQDMFRLNAGLLHWVTDPEGPHKITVPIPHAEALAGGIAMIAPATLRAQWQRHLVTQGETLDSLAQRYRTTQEMLVELNEVQRHTLRAGQALLVAVSRTEINDEERMFAARLRGSSAFPNNPIPEKTFYRVVKGDTLTSIARKFNTKPISLAKWNRMTGKSILRVGQRLVVWRNARTPKEPIVASLVDRPTRNTKAADSRQAKRYVVRRGDTLTHIAQRFKVSIAKLLAWNPGSLGRNRVLRPGQRITVFIDKAKAEDA